jgi:hypothetical protein
MVSKLRYFFIITKENYNDDEFIIDFNTVIKWLNVRKDNNNKKLSRMKKKLDKYFIYINK